MIARVMACFAVAALIDIGPLLAQEKPEKQSETAKVGDSVRIQLGGDRAIAYQKLLGAKESDLPEGLKVTFDATIKRLLKDGRVRVEQSFPIDRDGEPARLLTFEAEAQFRLITIVTPKVVRAKAIGEEGYNATPTRETVTERILDLPDEKTLKLRVWTMEREFAD